MAPLHHAYFLVFLLIAQTFVRADAPLLINRMSQPKIDGKVDVDEWKAAAPVELQGNSRGEPKARTRGLIGCDEKNLYIAFVCDEPLMGKVVAAKIEGRDGEVWGNECVEVLLNPQADRSSYLHFAVDILNQRYDALGSDPWGFSPAWESATARQEKSWSAEIAIPFTSLGASAPAHGTQWYGNLCRERKAEAELSAWRPTGGTFAAPAAFGVWFFGTLDEYGQAHEMEPRQAKEKLAAKAQGERFVVTAAQPYAAFDETRRGATTLPARIDQIMLRDEHVDLALDIANVTDQALVVRCTLHHGDNQDKLGYARLGIPDLETQWSQSIAVAAGDGRMASDAITPSPAGIIHVPAGASAQAWLSIHAPKDAAETHEGRIEIKPLDMGTEAVAIPLSVKVLPVTLTKNPPIHCFTWNFAHIIESQPKWWREHLLDLTEHGVDICMISSLNHLPRPAAKPDGSMPDQMDFAKLDRLLESTKGLFRLYWINLDVFEKAQLRTDFIGLEFASAQYERAFKQWLAVLLNHLRSRGLSTEQFLVNPYDESVDERCRTLARWVKEVDPKVRIVIDSSTPDLDVARKMNELTDVWVPHYRQFFPPEMKAFHEMIQASGKPRWAYFYSEGSNDKTQDPARHYLAKFWWAFANDVTGMGYWAQQYYGDPWHRREWKDSYDTALWYPIENGVAPSRRWEAWRRGWQDYLLLALTRNALAGNQAELDVLNQKVRQVVDDPADQARAEAVRS